MPGRTAASLSSLGSTLRLPRTTFPTRPVLADQSKYIRQCTDDLYQWQRAHLPASKTFVLHDGPPYANGSLHVGHALNKILKDITCRVQLYNAGARVDYVPGWDCHGLPIELKALQRQKELGLVKDGGSLHPIAIRQAARTLAAETVEQQKAEFRKWAIMADWDNAWKTMDKDFELKQLEVFKSMLESGLIYRRFKPVYWSPASRTALAEAELEYNTEHRSTAAFVKIRITHLPTKLRDALQHSLKHLYAVIWTTTPWTLLANKAMAVHSDMHYSVVLSANHGALIIATSRLAEVGKVFNEDLSQICLAAFKGSDLVGATYQHPALDSDAPSQPILHADFVSEESGSGLVHMAPGHGMDDYKLCLLHGIEPFAPVDDNGCFTEAALPGDSNSFRGKNVLTNGNKAVMDLLSAKGALIASYKYKHSYPYDWRMKQPVITRATQQWFADVGEIREAALRSLDDVKFVPESGKERLSSFVRNRSEWCISRQRAWGVPIPALFEEETKATLLTSESVAHIIDVIRERGIDAWWTDDEYEPVWTPPSLRTQGQYRRGRDTMDVWFDSGTSWTQTDKNVDIYLEGSDQHRGWFQSSLLTKIAFQTAAVDSKPPKAPYRTLITHGFTLDQSGKKMSKSEGNIISPDQIMDGTLFPPVKPYKSRGSAAARQPLRFDGLGPDALRLWVAGCDYTRDVIVGEKVLKAVNRSLIRLRMAFRFLTGILHSWNAEHAVAFDELGMIDQLALIRLRNLMQTVAEDYRNLEYQKVVKAINHYVSTDLSASYIESVKDRLYADARSSVSRSNAQAVIWQISKRLVDILAPITPVLVEEICAHLPSHLSYHPLKSYRDHILQETTNQADISGNWENKDLEQDLPYLAALNAAAKVAQEQARVDKKTGSSLQSFVSVQFTDTTRDEFVSSNSTTTSPFHRALNRNVSALSEFLVVSRVYLDSSPPEDAAWSYATPCEVGGHSAIVHVYAPDHDKCDRCWKYDVPKDDSDPEMALCARCSDVLKGLEGDVESYL